MLTPDALRNIYRKQANWFVGERNRLLRKADIARCRWVLDLGAGTGELLEDLDRRAQGNAIGVDADVRVLRLARGRRVAAMAQSLPFPDGTFDLVFTQMFFLWASPLDSILTETYRILSNGGCLIAAAEPDYGGVIEHPPNCADVESFLAQLQSEGADPCAARKLGEAMNQAGFQVECGVHPARPLEQTPTGAAKSMRFVFVPYFHFFARKRS